MKRACVIGWPIEHSRSPAIHGYWLKEYGIDGTYTKEAVPPDALAGFLGSLGARGLRGCNVTVPHKEAALRLADSWEPSAEAVGAANTLWVEGGKLRAANTDTYGFMTYLDACAPEWRGRDGPVAILGAGGAARAIVYGLLEAGVEDVRLFNRGRARAEGVAQAFGPRVRVHDWSDRSTASGECAMLVNTTSAGLLGEGAVDFDFRGLRSDCIVCDIVYVPLATAFLEAARRKDLKTVDGLGMLLHQAVPGFEKWFGKRPVVTDELYRLIAHDIEAG